MPSCCVCFLIVSRIRRAVMHLKLYFIYSTHREKEIRKFTFTEFTIMCIRPGEKGDKSASQVLRAFEVSHGSYKCVLIVSYEVRTYTYFILYNVYCILLSLLYYLFSMTYRWKCSCMYIHSYALVILFDSATALEHFSA
jgi:hypothetical protein